MAETRPGGYYLAVDGVTYVDAFGKPIEGEPKALRAEPQDNTPAETLVEQTERLAEKAMPARPVGRKR